MTETDVGVFRSRRATAEAGGKISGDGGTGLKKLGCGLRDRPGTAHV